MPEHPDHEIQQLIVFFRQAGISDLDKRLLVLRTFLTMESHPTLDELVEQVAGLRPGLDASFVEETMELLHRFGFARKLALEGEPLRYEHHHIGCHHDHLVCKRCGKIVEFENLEIESLQERVAESYGFKLIRHRMELYGLCAECSGDRKAWTTLSHADAGEKFFIDGFLGGADCRMRLLSMGLRAGDALEVISNHAGHVVAAVDQQRYSLGKEISEKILVRKNEKKLFSSEVSSRDGHSGTGNSCCTRHHHDGRRKFFKKIFSPFFQDPSRKDRIK